MWNFTSPMNTFWGLFIFLIKPFFCNDSHFSSLFTILQELTPPDYNVITIFGSPSSWMMSQWCRHDVTIMGHICPFRPVRVKNKHNTNINNHNLLIMTEQKLSPMNKKYQTMYTRRQPSYSDSWSRTVIKSVLTSFRSIHTHCFLHKYIVWHRNFIYMQSSMLSFTLLIACTTSDVTVRWL